MENSGANNIEEDALPQGTVLDDRYVTGRVIGSGGFGITYLAYDTVQAKKVAVKEYYPKGAAVRSPDGFGVEPLTPQYMPDFTAGRDRFRNESAILAKLGGSSDVIKVYDAFEQNGTAYYAMEYINGMTVGEYAEKHGGTTEGQALYTALEVTSAFARIHEKNIIHRDLSPNNVMIDEDGHVRLVDFGNARPFFFDGGNSMTVILKPGYAPLEQYQHHGSHGPWTDIYSLGAVLYYMLTLNAPDDPMTRFGDDSGFRRGLSAVNRDFAAVITKMTALKIEERYSDANGLLSDLAAVKIIPGKL